MKSYLSVYRIFLFVLGILGITLQVLDDGVGMFMYYTILSNLLVVLFLLFMILKKGNLSDAELRLRDGTAMSILITCVVYHFMLAPTAEAKDYYNLENFICHYILPIGFILDSLFSERFATKKTDPIFWASVPVTYFAFAILNGLLLHIPIPGRKNFYPYFFVDVDKQGGANVAIFAAVILAAYIACGYLYIGIKCMIHHRRRRNA